jgi:hypothetical protein
VLATSSFLAGVKHFMKYCYRSVPLGVYYLEELKCACMMALMALKNLLLRSSACMITACVRKTKVR